MDNEASGKQGKRKALSPTLGATRKKLREEGAGAQAADTADGAHSGAEAVRVVAAEEDGVDVATVEAEHRVLEARCERPTRITVAEAVATAPAPKGMVLRRRREAVVPVHPALPFAEEGRERRSRRWRGDGRTTVAKATSTPGRRAKRKRARADRELIEQAIARVSASAPGERRRRRVANEPVKSGLKGQDEEAEEDEETEAETGDEA